MICHNVSWKLFSLTPFSNFSFFIQNLKETSEFMRLAFNFLDYDDDGSIGSVDILNLRKSFNIKEVEEINVLFNKE